jgi:hypothetical protein
MANGRRDCTVHRLRPRVPLESPGVHSGPGHPAQPRLTGARHPQLIKSMLYSSLGRRARSGHRGRRVQAIMTALAGITSHLEPGEARCRSAAIAYLCSLSAWVTISEETGMTHQDAQRGIAWALDVLVADLRRESTSEHRSALWSAPLPRRHPRRSSR